MKLYFCQFYHCTHASWLPFGHFPGCIFTACENENAAMSSFQTSFEGELVSHLQMLLGTKAGHCGIPEVLRTMIPMLQHSLFWLEFDPNTH